MDLAASIKRVPRWAWYTSAGVGIGALALYIVRNRGGGEPTEDETLTSNTEAVTGYPDTYGPSPVPGIVVPSINIPESSSGQQGYLDLHNLYMEGLRDVLDSIGGGAAAAAPAPVLPNPLPVVITGGGAPATARNGVVTAKPTVKPCCLYNGHPLSWWRNPANGRKGGKWRWPGSGYVHSRAFEGNKACDGGGNAPGTKREC
jgi:hypothetical protein